jgi:CysZ protein
MRFLQDAIHGFRLPFQGMAYLVQHRSLWKWAALPALVNILLFSTAFAILILYIPTLYNLTQVKSSSTQMAWIWTLSLSALRATLGVLLILLSGAILTIAFLLLSQFIASPFLDMLAQRVEWLHGDNTQTATFNLRHLWRSLWVAIGAELKRTGCLIAVYLLLFLLGFIPVFAPFTALAGTLFTILFLPLQYAGYTMDHRLMTFRQRRRLIAQRPWLMFGFGVAAFLTIFIPLLNFVCLPMLVVGGTLLMMECRGHQPPAIGGIK